MFIRQLLLCIVSIILIQSSYAQFYNENLYFWDQKNQTPITISTDSTMFIGNEQSLKKFDALDLDDSKLNKLRPIYVNDTLYFVEPSGGVVVKYNDFIFERIDESFTHNSQHGSILFTYNGDIYQLGGYGLFTYKNIITRYDFDKKEWFLVETFGEIPPLVFSRIYQIENNHLYFFNFYIKQQDKSSEDPFVYKLDFETMHFSKLGKLNRSKDAIKQIYATESTKIPRLQEDLYFKRVESRNDQFYYIDFPSNTFAEVNFKDNNEVRKKIGENPQTNHSIYATYLYSRDEVVFETLGKDYFKDYLGEKSLLYQPNNQTSYVKELLILLFIPVLVFGVYLVCKKMKGFNKVRLHRKQKQLKYRFTQLQEFDPKEIDFLLYLSECSTAMEYSQVISYLEIEDEKASYDALKRKRKELIDSIILKSKPYLNGKSEELFIFTNDPNDKRNKLIALNKNLLVVVG